MNPATTRAQRQPCNTSPRNEKDKEDQERTSPRTSTVLGSWMIAVIQGDRCTAGQVQSGGLDDMIFFTS
jgi:hypothetical protein